MRRYYRYGMAHEKDVLLEMKEYFDGMVVPAHLLAYYPSLEPFLAKLAKPWFVDPVTFALKSKDTTIHSLHAKTGTLRLKRSYAKLLERISIPNKGVENPVSAEGLATGRRMGPGTFRRNGKIDVEIVKEFVTSVLKLQELFDTTGDSPQKQDRVNELLAKHDESAPKDMRVPPVEFKVPPYWFFDDVGHLDYEWNITFLETAVQANEESSIYAVIAADPSAITQETAAKISDDFSAASGFLIWLDDERLDAEGMRNIDRYHTLVESLASGGKEVISLYGTEMLATAEQKGLSGYCSGPGYGEAKPRARATGGAPPARYYVPRLMRYLTKQPLDQYLDAVGDIECPCRICRSLRDKMDFSKPDWMDNFTLGTFFPADFRRRKRPIATAKNRENHLRHFIEATAVERARLSSLTATEIAIEFEETYAKLADEDSEDFADEVASHLLEWAGFLRGLDRDDDAGDSA